MYNVLDINNYYIVNIYSIVLFGVLLCCYLDGSFFY